MFVQALQPGLQAYHSRQQPLPRVHAALHRQQQALRPPVQHQQYLPRPRSAQAATAAGPAASTEVDVVVVGSGIIGLLVTRQLLLQGSLSVALFDQQQPCAGATGAGQGYLWLAHRDPSSPAWALARRSKSLWEQLAAGNGTSTGANTGNSSSALASALEYQANGSLLLATTDAEVQQLQQRAEMLRGQGVPGVVLLSPRELAMAEPALQLPPGSRGLMVRSDAQINGKRAAFALLEDCQRRGAAAASSSNGSSSSNSSTSSSQLLVGLQEGVQQLTPLAGGGGGVEVVTSSRRVRARRGVVVAAGVWSGPLLASATGQPAWGQLLQPRRGHLLELQPPQGMAPIHTGMMELAYTQHYSTTSSSITTPTAKQAAAAAAGESPGGSSAGADGSSSSSGSSGSSSSELFPVDITFTATTSASGSLLIGSSREFSGWESLPSSSIIAAILHRASQFLPGLAAVQPSDVLASTRVGLRPYAVGGLPAIGPVPGLPHVFVAAGHEGSGLCLGPATAELVLQYLGLGPEEGSTEGSTDGQGKEQASLLEAAQELLPERRLATLGVPAAGLS